MKINNKFIHVGTRENISLNEWKKFVLGDQKWDGGLAGWAGFVLMTACAAVLARSVSTFFSFASALICMNIIVGYPFGNCGGDVRILRIQGNWEDAEIPILAFPFAPPK